MAINYDNFKFNSRQKIDNVVFTYSGSVQNISTYGTFISLDLPHTLPFIPLPFGDFSTDGGNTWQDIDFNHDTGYGSVKAYSTRITVGISTVDFVAGTVYIRVYAFPPATYQNSNIPKPTPLSKFYINTNNRYDNLVASGVYNVPANYETILYNHNLGYIPRCMTWVFNTYDNSIQRFNDVTLSYGSQEIWLTDTSLKAIFTDIGRTIHYRIYGGKNA